MPTRLVEMVSTQGERNLRLRETISGDKEPFAALSYCWGGEQLFKTTRHNLSQLIKGFSIQDLPPSLRDAVIATEKLGLHFIWVDALCIVQDDDYDKASEIALMPAIYNQAAVTIVASRAAGVNDGFLGPRPAFGATNPGEVFDLPYRCKDGILGSVTLIREVERSREPLDRRAWALQERLLSPRILDYGTYQTEWICQVSQEEKGLTDGWVDYHPDYWDKKTKERWDLLLLRSRALLDSSAEEIPGSIESEDLGSPHYQWYELVKIYTNRALTFSTDRLPAISGIAERYAEILRDEYVTGLWKSKLPLELLWARETWNSGEDRLKRRPREYQSPSWSWAVINGPIEFTIRPWFTGKIDEHFEVLDCRVQPVVNDAKFGAVQSSSLTLKGRMRPALWVHSDESGREKNDWLKMIKTPEQSWGIGLFRRRARIESDEVLAASVRVDCLEDEFIPKGTCTIQVHLLLIARHFGTIRGLVLRRHTTGEYSRLALFDYDIPDLDKLPGENKEKRETMYREQISWLLQGETQTVSLI